MTTCETLIEHYWQTRADLSPTNAPQELLESIQQTLSSLDKGAIRVAEPSNGSWVVHEWIKKAILLTFRIYSNTVIEAGFCQFYDKLPLKFAHMDSEAYQAAGVRIVPHA